MNIIDPIAFPYDVEMADILKIMEQWFIDHSGGTIYFRHD